MAKRTKRSMANTRTLRPDSKGRITLGRLALGISGFRVAEQPDGALLLEPLVEIPARERWVFENRAALVSVRKGLAESAKGETRPRGSFAKFADDDEPG